MRVAFPNQIKEMDRRCVAEYGIPELKLMENAGRNVYLETVAYCKRQQCLPQTRKVVCICGKGNNGGDGFVASRYFLNYGWDVETFVCASSLEERGSAAENYRMLQNMDAEVIPLTEEHFSYFLETIANADVVIDAIFGIGLHSAVRGMQAQVISAVNEVARGLVVAVDIPSGIDGNTGKVLGGAIRADLTVSMAVAKAGTLQYPGKEYSGELVVTEIGVPQELLSNMGIRTFETEGSLVKSLFPPRKKDSNKGTYGRVGIITGSSGMTGAGLLAARAALRTGAGLVYLIVPAALSNIYECASQETVTMPVGEDVPYFTEDDIPQVLKACETMDTIVLGPGIGREEETLAFLQGFLEDVDTLPNSENQTLILDADALNLLSVQVEQLQEIQMTTVLTPHPGEMARLYGTTVAEIQKDRIQVAKSFAATYETVVVLKGAATVTALPDGTVYLNPTGNPGMATAGSGDVLCGVLGAVTAGETDVDMAVPCGVYLHGLAGDIAAEQFGEYSMIAGDMVQNLGVAIQKIQKE